MGYVLGKTNFSMVMRGSHELRRFSLKKVGFTAYYYLTILYFTIWRFSSASGSKTKK